MAVRTVLLVTIALFVGIAAFVLHSLALCSPHWKISKRNVNPIMTPVSYGIWERCEQTNVTVIKQGVTVGTRTNVQYCFPNQYMRFTPESFSQCYNQRRTCPVNNKEGIPDACQCRYLPSTKALQWLTIIAAGFILLGLISLHFKTITSAGNNSAAFLLGFGPFLCFLLASLLMVTGLIVFGAYFKRDLYEDSSFPLQTLKNRPKVGTYNLHSLHIYAKSKGAGLTPEEYLEAEKELRLDANTHYQTVLGRAAVYEIYATGLILLDTVLTFVLSILSRPEDKI